MRAILREPLVHFLIVGTLIFLFYAAVSPAQDVEAEAVGQPSQVIVVDESVVNRLSTGFQATWRRPPSEEEAAGLLEAYINEEVLVREAQKLGLENGDSVVRQRLRLKMEFLIEGAAMPTDPGDEVLQTFLEDNAAAYSLPGKVAFQQVYLGERTTDADIAAGLEALNAGAAPETVGQRTLLPAEVSLSAAQSIDGAFGTGVFAALEGVSGDAWAGPVTSGFGYHLVRIKQRTAAEIPALPEIRERVLQSWQEDQAELKKREQIEALRTTYEVQFPPENGA